MTTSRRFAWRWWVLLAAIGGADVASSAEICGLPSTYDIIFRNGFERPATVTVPVPTLKDLAQRRQARRTTAPTLTITSPAPAAAIDERRI